MIVYARPSIFRKPEFQVLTTIEKQGAKKLVRKQALNGQATKHIKGIADNYKILSESNLPFEIIEPHLEKSGVITFEFVNGKRLDSEFYEAILNNDLDHAHRILDEVIGLMKGLPIKKLDPAKSPNYKKVFGASFEGVHSCVEIGYIDFNLDNFIQAKNKYYLIDYEWLFDCHIPLDLLIGRMLSYSLWCVSHFYRTVASEQMPVVSIGNDIFIAEATFKRYQKYLENLAPVMQAESALQKYVNGTTKKYAPEKMIFRTHTAPLFPSLINKLDHAENIHKHNDIMIKELKSQNQQLAKEMEEKDKKIQAIYESRTWRYGSKLVHLKKRIGL